jgi:ribosomal-protein-alanine N-acetyltransferase
MNDRIVTQYMETRHHRQTRQTIRNYICERSQDGSTMLAILLNARHIGNIKLGAVDPIHRYCSLAYFIGDRDEWGKGYATQAVRYAADYAFVHLKAHRVEAGVYAPNVASARVLDKAGFKHEGTQPRKYLCDNEWIDHLQYATIQE